MQSSLSLHSTSEPVTSRTWAAYSTDFRQLDEEQRAEYDDRVSHVTQSWEWGNSRRKQGVPCLRFGMYRDGQLVSAFSLTLHKLPVIGANVGYVPKGPFPDRDLADVLAKVGRRTNCIGVKVVPGVPATEARSRAIDARFQVASKGLFLKHTYVVDLTKPEDEPLRNAAADFRYSVRYARKRGVRVEERTDDQAFEVFYRLYSDTCLRAGYVGHDKRYHQAAWETLRDAGLARILLGLYTPEGRGEPVPLAAWMIYNFRDTLYYPYAGSSDQFRSLKANDLVAWEAINLGKRLGLKRFDLWGTLPPDSDPNHPWHGFSHFKAKLGGDLVEHLGTYDLVLNRPLYALFTAIDKFAALKGLLLKLSSKG
jgi:lipid II:glycine glycyltransferase (peptidoglycan interpeptide bridge formation enzyme)